MRRVLATVSMFAMLVIASVSHASPGSVWMSWAPCTAPVLSNIVVTAGDGVTPNVKILYGFVSGMSDPTQAYQLQIIYGDAANMVPDAWRFDMSGCQGATQVELNHIAPPSVYKACPTFQDAGGRAPNPTYHIEDISFSPPTLPYPTTLLLIRMVDSYGGVPIGSGNKPSPNVTYFLMDAEFNHQYSGIGTASPPETYGEEPPKVCRGVETPLCFHLVSASYLIDDGTGRELTWPISQEFLTVNDGENVSHCPGAVPAVPATWGSIKARYSR